MNLRRFWNNWSIRQRLLFITLLPVTYLFCMLVWHSYWSHSREVDEEINERGRIISQLLAKSSEYEMATNRLQELHLSMNNLVQSDPGIYSIDILGPDRKSILQSRSANKGQQHLRGFETPIVKRLMWINVISTQPDAQPHEPMRTGASTQIAGYAYVLMSPTELQHKQQQRFTLELLVAAIGLLMSAAMAVHLSRNLSASFRTFIEACRAIRAGRYPVHIDVTSGGEIGELQASINDMANSLEKSTQELENKVAQRTNELERSRNEAVKANDEKRKLIQKVQHIVEEERKNIAIEVHDELNASLITARLQAQRIAELADELNSGASVAEIGQEIKQHALSIKQTARSLYDNGRSLVRRLRPEALDMLGLNGAITEMINTYNSLHPSCHFSADVDGDFSALDSAAAMSVYRIIQEALSNSIKHADAQNASVSLHGEPESGAVLLQIADDGIGFEQEQVTAGIGLVGIRERVFALGGTIEIESGETGTIISIRIKN